MSQGSRKLLEQAEKILRQHLAPIYQYLEDPTVQEVMVNSPTNVWIERLGNCEKLGLELTNDALANSITILANINDKGSTDQRVLDCRLPGLRIAATLPPISMQGPSMSIRRHSAQVFTMDSYVEKGAFAPVVRLPRATLTDRPEDEEIASGDDGLRKFFEWLASSRNNFIVSGSTSSGKTALLNAMAAYIPANDRVLTIEDTAELKMLVGNWVSFESNPTYGVTTRMLVKHALRYRPNRIWVGEIRGEEAYDMLDAYNTGHPGSAVSFHSDSADMTLARLENMVRMASEASNWPLEDLRRQIAATFKFVLHASNLGGNRGPTEVMEILGVENGHYKTRSIFKKQIIYV
jgi:pilus assembly protein CpaF